MNDVEVRTLVQEALDAVAPGCVLDGVGPDQDLRKALDLDSLDFLNLIVRLDQRTGGRTAEIDYPKLTTLHGCVDFLGPRLAAR